MEDQNRRHREQATSKRRAGRNKLVPVPEIDPGSIGMRASSLCNPFRIFQRKCLILRHDEKMRSRMRTQPIPRSTWHRKVETVVPLH